MANVRKVVFVVVCRWLSLIRSVEVQRELRLAVICSRSVDVFGGKEVASLSSVGRVHFYIHGRLCAT